MIDADQVTVWISTEVIIEGQRVIKKMAHLPIK